jgi:peroxiredoxin
MAQLRQDYEQFSERDTAVLVVGPDNAQQFADYFTKNDLPFTGLPDPEHIVLKRYGQEIKIFKFGRMPAQALIDKQGIVRFVHYGDSMRDIPPTEEMLDLIDELNQEQQSASPR